MWRNCRSQPSRERSDQLLSKWVELLLFPALFRRTTQWCIMVVHRSIMYMSHTCVPPNEDGLVPNESIRRFFAQSQGYLHKWCLDLQCLSKTTGRHDSVWRLCFLAAGRSEVTLPSPIVIFEEFKEATSQNWSFTERLWNRHGLLQLAKLRSWETNLELNMPKVCFGDKLKMLLAAQDKCFHFKCHNPKVADPDVSKWYCAWAERSMKSFNFQI